MIPLLTPKTIIEPFKIKTIEPIPLLGFESRKQAIASAHFNLFKLAAQDVTFDLLTDSGTGAMSARQWAGILDADESYAGSKSFQKFETVIADLTGMQFVIPTHQGRSAENLLFKAMVKKDTYVVGNTHFDTTRANIESFGATPVDLPSITNEEASSAEFMGNINISSLVAFLEKNHTQTSLCVLTITNNSIGGLPVSLANIRQTKKVCQKYGIPMAIDAARFAENSYFIKKSEPEYSSMTVEQIAQMAFREADAVVMSSKKDAFANIGGFIATKDQHVALDIRNQMVLTEGFPTYGGLAGRDLEAIATGLREVLDESYLSYRLRSVAYFGEGLRSAGFKMVEPFGGHAVYIDAGRTLSHIPASQYPGQSLAVALYEGIGIRSVEVGSVMLGKRDKTTSQEIPAPKELVRLALPRRVYTQSHVDYMIELSFQLSKQVGDLLGFEIFEQPPFLRHFSAKFRRLSR